MIDLSNVEYDELLVLANTYFSIQLLYNISDPLNSTAKEQHKIRKNICKQIDYAINDFSENMKKELSQCNDLQFIELLKACKNELKLREKKIYDAFESEFYAFDALTKDALKKFPSIYQLLIIKQTDNNVQLIVEETASYKQTLTLTNAQWLYPNDEFFFCDNLHYKIGENGQFCLCGNFEYLTDNNICQTFEIWFDGAKAEVEVLNACDSIIPSENPWDFLNEICFSIAMKSKLPENFCNEAEKELLPIITEIAKFKYRQDISDETEKISLKNLIALSEKYGFTKITKLLLQADGCVLSDLEFQKIQQKLTSLLAKQDYLPIFREIFDKIKLSQENYPSISGELSSNELLINTRKFIQEYMEAHGYTGQYPNFVKNGRVNKTHIATSYGIDYLIRKGNAQYCIKCIESCCSDGDIQITFICGTAFLKRTSEPADIYDCMFNSHGKTLCRQIWCFLSAQDEDNNNQSILENHLKISVKIAECQKLIKQEKNWFHPLCRGVLHFSLHFSLRADFSQ